MASAPWMASNVWTRCPCSICESFTEVDPAFTARIATGQPAQDQSTTSGRSSPCSRVHALARMRESFIR